MNEKFLIGLLAVFITYATGYLYGHDFGYEDGKAYQRTVSNDRLQNCHKLIARHEK